MGNETELLPFLDLSYRTASRLERMGMVTFADVLRMGKPRLMKVDGLGIKSLREIEFHMADRGLCWPKETAIVTAPLNRYGVALQKYEQLAGMRTTERAMLVQKDIYILDDLGVLIEYTHRLERERDDLLNIAHPHLAPT